MSKTRRNTFVALTAALLLAPLAALHRTEALRRAAERNIVFVLTDDMGYSDPHSTTTVP